MKKLWVLFLVTVIGAIFCLGVSLPAMAGNCGYVVNGDFEVTDKVNLGFETDYEYLLYPDKVNYSGPWLYNVGEMTIVENPGYVHDWGAKSYWADYEYEDGKMLVVNGSKSDTTKIWKQTFSLRPNTNYVFSFELANVCVWDEHTETYQIAQINLNKDDYTSSSIVLDSVSVPYNVVGIFQRFEVIINSGETGTFDLFFTNNNTSASANDFAMDNICMRDLMIDIKPGSCPNAFNLKQKGLLSAAILGSEFFDVTQIVKETVQLCLNDNCIDPVRVEELDAGKFLPCLECQECDCNSYSEECDSLGNCSYDDFLDLALKFNSTDVAGLLIGEGHEPGSIVTMTIKAEYYALGATDPETIQGQDCIVIVNQ